MKTLETLLVDEFEGHEIRFDLHSTIRRLVQVAINANDYIVSGSQGAADNLEAELDGLREYLYSKGESHD